LIGNNSEIEEVIMQSHLKELTVEQEVGGCIVSRTVLFPVYTVLQWFDDFGDIHQLMLCGSDLVWLSQMGIEVEDRSR
jgi:hypothetical protein